MSYAQPYDEEMLPSYDEIVTYPAVRVRNENLKPTQPLIWLPHILALESGTAEIEGDVCLHVVEVDGELFIHDGHHRWLLAMLRGEECIWVRIIKWWVT